MALPNQRTVRVHRQAVKMADTVREHLRHHPERGVLFILDYERALADMGFRLSRGMREHLARQLPSRTPGRDKLYEYFASGGSSPVELTVSLSDPADDSGTADETATGRSAHVPVPHVEPREVRGYRTSGFSVILQLTEGLIQRILDAAYDAEVFPKNFTGGLPLDWPDFKIEADARFGVELGRPTVRFDTALSNAVSIAATVSGYLELEVAVMQFLNPTHPELQDTIRIEFNGSFLVVAGVRKQDVGGTQQAIAISLEDLRSVEVNITSAGLPTELRTFLEAVVVRIIRTEFAERKWIPLTFVYDRNTRSGITITDVQFVVRRASGSNPATLTIALDTSPTPDGDLSKVGHMIPAPDEFAVFTAADFLLTQAWPLAAARFFPYVDGRTTVKNPELRLLDDLGGHIWFKVDAEYQIDCLPNVNATATARLRFATFVEGGITKARLDTIGDPDIDVSIWDQIFYSVLAFLLGSIFSPGGGLILLVVLNVLIEVLEDVAGSAAGNAIEGFSVGFRARIPGTPVVAAASVREAPRIGSAGIFGSGAAVFLVEP